MLTPPHFFQDSKAWEGWGVETEKIKPLKQLHPTKTKIYVSLRSFKDQAFSFSINKEFLILGLENISESILG